METQEKNHKEASTETPPAKRESVLKKPWLQSVIGIVLIGAALGIFFVVRKEMTTVKIDNSTIEAPLINLSPTAPGTLQATYVQIGDSVVPDEPLALVGTQVITSQVAGTVVSIDTDLGGSYAAGQTVATLIQPSELRVVGQIEENKGLSKLAVGQPASFTVDAFGSKKFYGVVDSIAPTANASDVVFDISDEREEQIFDVKIRYDVTAYPQLKNGMSAKLTIDIQ